MPTCLIALGCNLGDCRHNLQRAVSALDQLPQTRVTKVSSFLSSRAIGGPPDQGSFLNAAALIETRVPATDLLAECLRMEDHAGRRRQVRWGARPLDLDMLLYGDSIIDSSRLVVPHPWLPVRRFVLEPAAEIAADMRHPVCGWTLGQLWRHLAHGAAYFAVVGAPEHLVRQVLRGVSTYFGVPVLWRPRTDTASGRPGGGEIEFFRRIACKLAGTLAEHPEQLMLTDFWWPLEQTRVSVDLHAPPAVDFPACKLLVVLANCGADEGEANATSLLHTCLQLRDGPLLRLDVGNRARLEHELIAAIESMQ